MTKTCPWGPLTLTLTLSLIPLGSALAAPAPAATAAGDVNGDRRVDVLDLMALYSWYFSGTSVAGSTDVDRDGDTDWDDISAMWRLLSSTPGALAGDANGDGSLDLSDMVYLGQYLAGSGPAPASLTHGDANQDRVISFRDISFLGDYLFGASALLGDVDANGSVNVLDYRAFRDWLFLGGTRPASANNGDMNDDGRLDLSDLMILANRVYGSVTVVRGDANGDGNVDLSDSIFLADYVVNGGPAPAFLEQGDFNGDGAVDIFDMAGLLGWLFGDGPAPAPLGSEATPL